MRDETGIGMTNLTKIQIHTGNSKPVSQKPFLIAMKHYDWVKIKINKLLDPKLICSSHSSWSVLIIIIPKGEGGKHLVINYGALNKVTQKFILPMSKVKDIFSKLNDLQYFQSWISKLDTVIYPLMMT